MYFLLGYHDQQRLFPYIETLIYLGTEVVTQTGEKHHVFAYANADTITAASRVVEFDGGAYMAYHAIWQRQPFCSTSELFRASF